ncbi:DUF1697 domain-containing protein [Nannocystis bainbridge]|uniref:DUF1697 domain-containing protein n=1 Tax=Nannocystis bainbridge TaxID=2995303 RepID=A0ABT5E9A4_9BACT|nr:DUF1697 domain-containing protein [Nannocystis bainbridge]MDC0722440.1 DUF1697 domain-containing protein [Nannocystis bainbridge]
MTRFIALLRGINVGGTRKVPMADLRALCGELGLTAVQTYIQSGNVVFTANGSTAEHEAALEQGLTRVFGLQIDVMVRTADQWEQLAAGNPLRAAAEAEANLVLLGVPKRPPRPDAAAELLERATAGERVVAAGDVLWFHYPQGAGRTKLSPAVIDRLVGSPVTARNWRTVLQLAAMVKG